MSWKIFISVIIFVAFIFTALNFFLEPSFRGNSIEETFNFETEEKIIIPVKVHLIIDDSGEYASTRTYGNIVSLFEEANRIWEQGGIHFRLEGAVPTDVSFEAIPNAINGNYQELINHENFDGGKINLFLAQSLNNINGLALSRINSVLVADFTTVNDFRTTAHEFGHLLGLGHIAPSNRLMARGKNGELLTKEEVLIARRNAENLFVIENSK